MIFLLITEQTFTHAKWLSVKYINFMFRTNHVALHSFAIFGASLIDVLASLVGAYKTDGFDGRMVTDEVHSYNNKWKKIILLSAHRIWIIMWSKYL